jgi:hypothetical protein
MKEFKLLRGYTNKRVFVINVGPINEREIEETIRRLRRNITLPTDNTIYTDERI